MFRFVFFAMALMGCTLVHGAPAGSQKPNVILILADDLGWTDLACYGSDLYQSPNIDQLAADGERFTANYSACTVCSPTRAALLAGKYPARLHVTDWIPGLPPGNPKLLVPDFTKHLPLEEITLAELFKQAGYRTASIGKWHLGGEEYCPTKHGFDVNIGGDHSPQPRPGYFAPYDIKTLAQGPKGEYITDRLGAEAAKFIRESAGEPFFLYLPHFAVHTPIQAKKGLIKQHQAKVTPDSKHQNAAYGAMVQSMDQTVGRIRKLLEKMKIADNTIIVFTSDNGGRIPTTSNAPLRFGKGSAYEGGVRVPLIVYAPGVTTAGSECDVSVITMDIYPTIAQLAGLSVPKDQQLDGVSLVPLLERSGDLAERDLFWHYPHYQHYQQGGATPYGAIRRGDLKLIEYYADNRCELYNLADDIGETNDLASMMPEQVEELREALHQWRDSVGAQMAQPNPNYDPAQPEDTRKSAQNRSSAG